MFLQTTTLRGEKLPEDSSEQRARGTPKIQLCRCTTHMQTIMLLSGAARNQTNRDGVNREDGEDHNFISLPSGTRNT